MSGKKILLTCGAAGVYMNGMERTYTFIQDTIRAGHVVLAYDRRAVPCRVRRVKSMDRVTLASDGNVYVDGECAKGWTICRKP